MQRFVALNPPLNIVIVANEWRVILLVRNIKDFVKKNQVVETRISLMIKKLLKFYSTT